MYLKSLKIYETIPTYREIRNVIFKTGLNIIVDESTSLGGKGNNVGKTTFLKIIDICLGSKDKKYIWTDSDSGSETLALKKYIHENKVCAELIIDLTPKTTITTKVELFNKGKKYINGKRYNQNDFNEELNKYIFKTSTPPSFRQLIGKFVRINLKSDNYSMLKYLNFNTTDITYQNIYDFLFILSSKDTSALRLELKNEIKSIENDLANLFRLHNLTSEDDLNQRTTIVNNSVEHLQKQFHLFIDSSTNTDRIEKSSDIKKHIISLNDNISLLEFKQNKIANILSNEQDTSNNIEHYLLLDFYKELTTEFETIKKTFDELLNFNMKLKENKIKYYKKRLLSIKSDLDSLQNIKDQFIKENSDILALVDNKDIEEFEKTHRDLLGQTELLGELRNIQTLYNKLNTDLACKESDLDDLDINEPTSHNLPKFNNYFTNISNDILGQRLYLSTSSPFPMRLSNVDDGIGTGHRKTITLLLDIAYVSFLEDLKIDLPRFFVHDVLETIDEHNMRKLVNYINSNGSQFIFAILNEKIEQYDFIKEEDKRLKLSVNNKLFNV